MEDAMTYEKCGGTGRVMCEYSLSGICTLVVKMNTTDIQCPPGALADCTVDCTGCEDCRPDCTCADDGGGEHYTLPDSYSTGCDEAKGNYHIKGKRLELTVQDGVELIINGERYVPERALAREREKWGELRQQVAERIEYVTNSVTPGEGTTDRTLGVCGAVGALNEVEKMMDRLDEESTLTRGGERACKPCCGTVGMPGSIVCTCKHAYYDIGHTTTETDEKGNVWLNNKGAGFKCALKHDTSWVARDGCTDWTPRGEEG